MREKTNPRINDFISYDIQSIVKNLMDIEGTYTKNNKSFAKNMASAILLRGIITIRVQISLTHG